MKSKVSELGIFAMGIGVILGALVVLLFVNAPLTARTASWWSISFPLGICVAFFVSGVLTLAFRNRAMILFTSSFMSLGLILDLVFTIISHKVGTEGAVVFIGVKLAISGLIVFLIIKTAIQAIRELNEASPDDQPVGPSDNARVLAALASVICGAGSIVLLLFCFFMVVSTQQIVLPISFHLGVVFASAIVGIFVGVVSQRSILARLVRKSKAKIPADENAVASDAIHDE